MAGKDQGPGQGFQKADLPVHCFFPDLDQDGLLLLDADGFNQAVKEKAIPGGQLLMGSQAEEDIRLGQGETIMPDDRSRQLDTDLMPLQADLLGQKGLVAHVLWPVDQEGLVKGLADGSRIHREKQVAFCKRVEVIAGLVGHGQGQPFLTLAGQAPILTEIVAHDCGLCRIREGGQGFLSIRPSPLGGAGQGQGHENGQASRQHGSADKAPPA